MNYKNGSARGQKNIFKISFQKFGNNKKLVQSLHPQNKKHVTQTATY